MKGTNKGIVLALLLSAAGAVGAAAEPSYLIYPGGPAIFRFDPARYVLVTSGNPVFDPTYAIGGQMLWDRVANRIPFEVYRAPMLIGFQPSSSGGSEFVTSERHFSIVVDGFGEGPRTLGSLCLRFWPEPSASSVQLDVNGQAQQQLTFELAPLEVSTLMSNGFYADTQTIDFSWTGSSTMRIVAFSDKNGDHAFEGTPVFTIVALDATVPVAPITWGRLKALYR